MVRSVPWLGWVVISACSFDPSGPAATSDGGAPDAAPADAGHGFPYKPQNFDPFGLEPAGPVVLDCGESLFDTLDLRFDNWCGQPEPTPVSRAQPPDGPGLIVLAFTELTIAEGSALRVTGDGPLILAVFASATIDGTLMAGARTTTSGPGADPGCAGERGTDSDGAGAGGGGGGFGGAGGPGGQSASGAGPGTGSPAVGDPALVPLRGGCPGGTGGADSAGFGGGGGGAVQVSAAAALSIAGVVASPGGGGRGGSRRNGGGGGGSGGGILLEAMTVALAPAARVTANGGGGGEGGSCSTTSRKAPGADGRQASAEPAPGGRGSTDSGGDGGAGAAGSSGASTGLPGAMGCLPSAPGGGGGGGGGPGRIRVVGHGGCELSALFSPAPSTSCP